MTHANPRAIFFDMDGTLIDWQTGMEDSWLASCEAHADGSWDPQLLFDTIRTRRTWFWADQERATAARMDLDAASRTIVRHAFDDLGLRAETLAHAIADDYRARRDACMTLYPGAIETLEAVRLRGLATGLITNGAAKSQRRSVERFDLARQFDCVIIEGEFGVGKPDERVFRHALAACDVDASDAWMVGDSAEADIATPVRLGMHAVWINPDGASPPAGITPHRVIASVANLFD